MQVVSTSHGFVLSFQNKKDLEQHLKNLQGQKEWIERESVSPPFLYSVYSEETSTDDIEDILDKLKGSGL